MLNIIKNKLKLTNKKSLFITVLLFLAIPLVSEAAIGIDIFSAFSAMLEGISETAIPFKLFFVFLFLALIVSKALLAGSVWLLEFASNPAHLEIMESEFVQIGWQFTSSLANTGIIIILIIIGIATILNKESLGAKKALPKLIIVALLVNFSLVFVGMVVDISNIILMTFFEADIGEKIVSALSKSGESMITSMGAYLTASLISFAIPPSAPFAQITFILAMFGSFLPQIVDAVMQTLTSLLIAGALLSYSILFLARIFIIQILAIFSPLAFIAWTIDKTKKTIWDRWLKALVQWSLLGVVLLFFLLLATIAVEPLRPQDSMSVFDNSSGFKAQIASLFIYYSSLGVFLIVTLKIANNFMPEGAQAVIDGVQQAASGFKKAAAPMTRPITREIDRKGGKEKQEEAKEAWNKADNIGEKAKAGTQRVSNWASRKIKHAGSGLGTKYDDEDLMKDKTDEELVKKLNNRYTPDHVKEKITNMLADRDVNEKTKDPIAQNWNKIKPDKRKDIIKNNPEILIDVEMSNVDRSNSTAVQKAHQDGIEKIKEEFSKISPSEFKNISKEVFTNKKFGKELTLNITDDHQIIKQLKNANKDVRKALSYQVVNTGINSNNKQEVEKATKIFNKMSKHPEFSDSLEQAMNDVQ
ncbi:MAG: hypothetical protein ACQEP3_01000 [Patescibacteria group bacterium]